MNNETIAEQLVKYGNVIPCHCNQCKGPKRPITQQEIEDAIEAWWHEIEEEAKAQHGDN
jgi:hypothetical protein